MAFGSGSVFALEVANAYLIPERSRHARFQRPGGLGPSTLPRSGPGDRAAKVSVFRCGPIRSARPRVATPKRHPGESVRPFHRTGAADQLESAGAHSPPSKEFLLRDRLGSGERSVPDQSLLWIFGTAPLRIHPPVGMHTAIQFDSGYARFPCSKMSRPSTSSSLVTRSPIVRRNRKKTTSPTPKAQAKAMPIPVSWTSTGPNPPP